MDNTSTLFKHSKARKSRDLDTLAKNNGLTSWCKTENVEPIWKILMEGVDLVEPTRFLDHANLGCTQREFQISKDIASNYRRYVRPDGETISSRSHAWKDIANLRVKRLTN